MRILKKFFSILGWFLVAILLTAGIWNCVDKFSGYKYPPFGYRFSSIGSSSMEVIYPGRELPEDTQRIKKGDIIVTMKVWRYEDLYKNEVITYFDGTYLICHRIVDLYTSDGKNYIVTQGDANINPDTPFEFSLVTGKVVNVYSGGIAEFIVFMLSGWGLMAIFFSAGFICLGVFIYANCNKENKKEVSTSGPGLTNNKKPKK